MTELERLLVRTGRDLDWPVSPDVAAPVAERLAREPLPPAPRRRDRPRFGQPWFARPLVLALVALLLVGAVTAAAVPAARDAVLELFGLRGATVERREELPSVAPGPGRLRLGERLPLDRARRHIGFVPLLPAALPPPDAVHVRPRAVPGGELSFSYEPRPDLPETATTGLGLLVTEFRGDLDPQYLGKIAAQVTRVERLRIGGRTAIWIEGAPHLFFYRDAAGGFREGRHRLAANVLLLERGRVLVRLEGSMGLPRAAALARSLSRRGAVSRRPGA